MSILIVTENKDPRPWIEEMKKQFPGLEIYTHTDSHKKEDVAYAISWNHPEGIFKHYPNLKVIASLGAGVDHIIRDPEIPENVAITRIIDSQLASDMAEFVLALVMGHLRDISYYQDNKEWKQKPYLRIKNCRVGIMGAGVLGKSVAGLLSAAGFKVSGWSKTEKQTEAMFVYGENRLSEFLSGCDILICLLPLTPETKNILDKNLLQQLPKGAYLINVARGNHLVDEDLLELLDSGYLSGAALDVFRTEPLPEAHPFWKHPKVLVTPHVASITDPVKTVEQLIDNYRRMLLGNDLKNTVDRQKGY